MEKVIEKIRKDLRIEQEIKTVIDLFLKVGFNFLIIIGIIYLIDLLRGL